MTESKTVVITGSGKGIGLAIARSFCEQGFNLGLLDLDQPLVDFLSTEFAQKCIALKCDVTHYNSVCESFNTIISKFGQVDIVCANAGVSSMKRAIDLTEKDWDFNFDVNAKGVFFTNQVALKHFLKNGIRGVIINTASLAAKVGAPFLSHYSASKFAVLGWTQSIAREYADKGIRINAVCPGFVDTSMQEREIKWEAELLGITPKKVKQSYIDQTPLGRLETPEDVADVVSFLASESARFMTGQGVNVTGGVYMG